MGLSDRQKAKWRFVWGAWGADEVPSFPIAPIQVPRFATVDAPSIRSVRDSALKHGVKPAGPGRHLSPDLVALEFQNQGARSLQNLPVPHSGPS